MLSQEMAPLKPMRPYLGGADLSTSHKDLTDEKYRELRRPKKIMFYCNGNQYFKGKRFFITPHRYVSFNDLLSDLTGKLPTNVSLPYGVRQIYTPMGGRRIRDIEDLQDGRAYVCAGFENFKQIKYGRREVEPWQSGRPHFHPEAQDTGQRYGSQFLPYGSGGGPPYRPGNAGPSRYGYYQPNRPPHRLPPTTLSTGGYPGRARDGPGGYPGGLRDGGGGYPGGLRDGGGRQPGKYPDRDGRYQDGGGDGDYPAGPDDDENHPGDVTIRGPGGEPRVNIISEHPPTTVYLSHRPPGKMGGEDATFASGGPGGVGAKPNVVTVVRGGDRPFNHIKILLNRRSVRSYEQLLGDISESFGPKWKNNRVRKLYTLLGREVVSLSDFFRGDSIFIAVGNEKVMLSEVHKIIQDVFPDNPYAQSLLQNSRPVKRRPPVVRNRRPRRVVVAARDSTDEGELIIDDPYYSTDDKENDPVVHVIERYKLKSTRNRYGEPRKVARRIPPRRFEVIQEYSEMPESETDDLSRGNNARRDHEQMIKRERDEMERQRLYREMEERIRREQEERDSQAQKGKVTTTTTKTTKEIGPDGDDKKHAQIIKTERVEIREESETGDLLKPLIRRKTKIRFAKTRKERLTTTEVITESFEIGDKLGDGNFAIVRRCKHNDTGKEYAMKIIDKSKLKGKEHMIENEISIMKACSHTNLIKLADEFETDNEIYLVLELVKGSDLFDAISSSVRFPEHQAASMTADITNALLYLHSRNIVHRDLKPENLLVVRHKDNSISLKLGDFGLAVEVTSPIFTICGTPTYVAPEILSEIGYGLEVDMWAVGVITYILLCGFPPFHSADRKQTELFEFIKAGHYEFLAPYWDNVSNDAKDLIQKLLVVDKTKRYTAIDILCHPWIMSVGGSAPTPVNLKDHQTKLREKLEAEAAQSLQSWRDTYTKHHQSLQQAQPLSSTTSSS